MEDYYLGKASERIFLPLIRKTVPEIVDMNFPAEGIFHNLVIISIDKRYPGHARKIMNAVWGLGQLLTLGRELMDVPQVMAVCIPARIRHLVHGVDDQRTGDPGGCPCGE